MATNLALDDTLVNEVLAISGKKTKKAAVSEALAEYLARRQQLRILELFGTIDYDEDYDYKEQRNRE